MCGSQVRPIPKVQVQESSWDGTSGGHSSLLLREQRHCVALSNHL